MSEAEYMALKLITNSTIWLINSLEELNMPTSNITIFFDYKATIDSVYNPKIND
jgi:hypothetical protein